MGSDNRGDFGDHRAIPLPAGVSSKEVLDALGLRRYCLARLWRKNAAGAETYAGCLGSRVIYVEDGNEHTPAIVACLAELAKEAAAAAPVTGVATA